MLDRAVGGAAAGGDLLAAGLGSVGHHLGTLGWASGAIREASIAATKLAPKGAWEG